MTDERPQGYDQAEREKTLLELLRFDYDATLRTMSGVVTTGGQIRAIGIAAWGVVLGLAVKDRSIELSALAVAIVLVFSYADAYHGVLYRRTLQRAIKLEALIDGWIARLGIDADDPDAVRKARSKLEMHRFGVHRSMRRPGWKDLRKARPRPVFWVIYPGLLLASLAAVVAYACS